MQVPDKWILIEFNGTYKVLGGWSGGYLDGDSWRLSSGLVKIEDDPDSSAYFLMHNVSGSIYKCHKNSEGVNIGSASIADKLFNIGAVQISVKDFRKVND